MKIKPEELFETIIKYPEKGHLRGVNVGMTLDDVYVSEGRRGETGNDGSDPVRIYEYNPLDHQTFHVYYHYDQKSKVINEMRLVHHLYVFPTFRTLNIEEEFFSYLFTNGLEDITSTLTKTVDLFVLYFTNKYGNPKKSIEEEGTVYEKRQYSWNDPSCMVQIILTYYFYDDTDAKDEIRKVLQFEMYPLDE